MLAGSAQELRKLPKVFIPVAEHIRILLNYIDSVSTPGALLYSERRQLAHRVMAVSVARKAFKIFLDGHPDASIDKRRRYGDFEPDQLFFRLSCFSHCGARSRDRVLQVGKTRVTGCQLEGLKSTEKENKQPCSFIQ